MRRAATLVLLAAIGLAAFALSVFSAEPAPDTGKHWAAAPLLAFTIVGGMSGLVAVAASRRGSLK